MSELKFSLVMALSGLIIFPFSFKYFNIQRNIFVIITLSAILGISCFLLPSKFYLLGVGITAVIGVLLTKHNEPLDVFKAIGVVVISGIPLLLLFN